MVISNSTTLEIQKKFKEIRKQHGMSAREFTNFLNKKKPRAVKLPPQFITLHESQSCPIVINNERYEKIISAEIIECNYCHRSVMKMDCDFVDDVQVSCFK